MPKQPSQPPIVLHHQGAGKLRMVTNFTVTDPPEGCETQQLMDWACVLVVLALPQIDVSRRARVIGAYAERWDIAMDDAPSG